MAVEAKLMAPFAPFSWMVVARPRLTMPATETTPLPKLPICCEENPVKTLRADCVSANVPAPVPMPRPPVPPPPPLEPTRDVLLARWKTAVRTRDQKGVVDLQAAILADENAYRDSLVQAARVDVDPRVRAFCIAVLGRMKAPASSPVRR